MEQCIFCKIANKEIPVSVVYEDDRVMAFKDINPVAPVHVLIISKVHIANLKEIDSENESYLIDIHKAANKVAEKLGIAGSGFRLISNCGEGAGQTVFHLHYHLIGGTELGPKLI